MYLARRSGTVSLSRQSVSQPAVRQAVTQLGARLSQPSFSRAIRGVWLTRNDKRVSPNLAIYMVPVLGHHSNSLLFGVLIGRLANRETVHACAAYTR